MTMVLVELRDYHSTFGIVFIVSFLFMQSQNSIADPQISQLASTREHFNLETGLLNNGHNETDYDASHVPGLQSGTSCPKEVAIYVHGVWTGIGSSSANFENETGIFNRARMSLAANNYSIPLIGFSWDSNTTITLDGSGWLIAKGIAQNNGPKLADFIFDYKSKCPDIDIRVVAHSLGAKVVLNALQGLSGNPTWNSNNFKVESVHLMGAAVDDEQVSTDPSDADDPEEAVFGQSIESQVNRFYNLFDMQDNALEIPYYPNYEGGETALGLNGAEQGISLPRNYQDVEVTEEIPLLIDANGDGKCDLVPFYCTIVSIGDNHLGYVGFASASNGNLIDDGAMNITVNNWRS
jgi:hypothetical protein